MNDISKYLKLGLIINDISRYLKHGLINEWYF